MSEHAPEHVNVAGPRGTGLPVAPSLGPAADMVELPPRAAVLDRRVVFVGALAAGVAVVAALVAQGLAALIALITNLAFHGRLSAANGSPLGHGLGLGVIGVPVVGGLLVGLMARYGSKAIRGHGIPEAMEQVLWNESRIPIRMTFLKPLSAAIAIGTGGPFGAEGPIIATGGALGSLLGQVVRVTADERKTLLAAGAAAGMSATFGTPVSAVLLAIELLLFEYRARSVIPVALAASTAAAVRIVFVGAAPVFPLPEVTQPGGFALAIYVLIGACLGLASVGATRIVYWVEDSFEKLPLHWMWWPALGGIAVGLVGLWEPRTLGVGYPNIEQTLRGDIFGGALLILCLAKLVSWSIALGSGTSGGTLAPLFTIGGALGSLCGAVLAQAFPGHAIDPRIGALVGMAAIFAGASRALLTSVVFAFECTRQPIGLLPLLGGCSSAYIVSCLAMTNSIMTEKLARRGTRISAEYQTDFLDGLLVRDFASSSVVTLDANMTFAEARAFLDSNTASARHQGFPVVRDAQLIGVLTRRDLLANDVADTQPLATLIKRAPVVVHPRHTLRQAADIMVTADLGRVVVVHEREPRNVVGILTRSDLLGAHRSRLHAGQRRVLVRSLAAPWRKRRSGGQTSTTPR
jgi:chloride channel protein, CIC family